MTSDPTTEKAISRGVSLFQMHLDIIEECARERRMRGNTFSPAVQFIVEEWWELRQMLALLSDSQRQELRQRLAEESAMKGGQITAPPTA